MKSRAALFCLISPRRLRRSLFDFGPRPTPTPKIAFAGPRRWPCAQYIWNDRAIPWSEPERAERGSERAGAIVMKPDGCAINVKPALLRHRGHGRFTLLFMIQRRLTRTNQLGLCLVALRDLAKSNDPYRSILVERHIDEYLRTDPFSLAHALERLRRAIHYEEVESRQGEDWSIARNYVRSLLHRIT